jgi:hypothetical protein
MKAKEKAKAESDCRSPKWKEMQEKAPGDAELSERQNIAKHMIERYGDALRRLADF